MKRETRDLPVQLHKIMALYLNSVNYTLAGHYLRSTKPRRLKVATSRWILVAALAAILVSAGCNSGSTSNVQNPPPPPQQGVAIAFQSAPPTSVAIGSTAGLTAVVTNDSTNSGVDWSLTCAGGNCGSLSSLHTSSGQATTYTPPSALTGNTEIVNIAGFATADHSQNVLASLNVTAFGNSLIGTYVLEVQGFESGVPYEAVAAIVLDGNGNVTSGEQTVNFVDASGSYTSSSGPIVASGSSYFLGPDGRGTLNINPGTNSTIGPETFSLAYLSNAHLLIAATTNPNSPGNISASGTMDLQATTGIAALSGGYAFVMQGADFNGAGPTAIGGVFNVDNLANNPNNISGAGSIADENVFQTLNPRIPTSGSVSAPDTLGVVNLTLTLNNPSLSTATISMKGYMVDPTHMMLIEEDQGGFGSVAGLAIGQGSSTGTFLTDAQFSGTYVFGLLGVDFASNLPDTFTSAGVVTADGAGSLTNGYADSAFQALISPVTFTGTEISGTFNTTYSPSATGTGRYNAFLAHFTTPNGGYQPQFIFYLTGSGSPALVLASGNTTGTPFPFFATGVAYPQATGPFTFSGNYGLYFSQQNGTEFDGTAEMNVSSSSFSGVTDVGSNAGQAFIGTVSSATCSPTVSGCFSGSFSNNSSNTGLQGSNNNIPGTAFVADFYMIDSTQGFFVENDLLLQNTPQVSLGYFAASTLPQAPAAAKAKVKAHK